jgi:hypothetical protein
VVVCSLLQKRWEVSVDGRSVGGGEMGLVVVGAGWVVCVKNLGRWCEDCGRVCWW